MVKKKRRDYVDMFTQPDEGDLVSFSIICQPRSGARMEDLREKLSTETLEQFLPEERVLKQVEAQLRRLGFKVFPGQRTLISASGSVELFTSVFGGRLVTRTRTFSKAGRQPEVAIVLSEKSPEPSPSRVDGALSVVVMDPPTPLIPLAPPRGAKRNLRVPGDFALITQASRVHRRQVSTGQQATGGDVAVAVLDSGFSNHLYYGRHDYQITRVSASDQTGPPDEDLASHGTRILACLLACAPDVHAHAIRMGMNPAVALEDASKIPGLRVVSLSWVEDLDRKRVLPNKCLVMQVQILSLIASGVTVVAAAGNGETAFPAMMPEVIAVGGAEIDDDDGISVWPMSSSFSSSLFKGRWVPDLCAMAGEMMLPEGAAGPPFGWEPGPGGTSSAAPQVAGIAALLIQKNPALTPNAVRDAMKNTAADISSGTAASGEKAIVGPDQATGAGLVNAWDAWQTV